MRTLYLTIFFVMTMVATYVALDATEIMVHLSSQLWLSDVMLERLVAGTLALFAWLPPLMTLSGGWVMRELVIEYLDERESERRRRG